MEKMLRLIMVVAIVVCGFSMLTSCSSDNDDTPNKKEYDGVPLVILDTDIGSSTDELFTLSERGIVTLTPYSGTIFTPSATGNHRYQKPGTQAWCQAMLEKIRKSLRRKR
jgi:hypothetical protein